MVSSSPPLFNGWGIAFHPFFLNQRHTLLLRTRSLKKELEHEEWKQHTDVKLVKAVMVGIREKITLEPFASHFALRPPLQKYCRLKKMGLPERYRLFFRPLVFDNLNVIIILWLGYPRKEGAKDDCYEVFTAMVSRGEFPEGAQELFGMSRFLGA